MNRRTFFKAAAAASIVAGPLARTSVKLSPSPWLRGVIHSAALLSIWLVVTLGSGALHAEPLRSFQSRYYQVKSDLSTAEIEPIAEQMNAVFAAYQRRFSQFKRRPGASYPTLRVYRKRKDYLEFLANQGANGSGSDGVFVARGDVSALVTFVEGKSLSRVFETLRHEGVHQFVWSRIGPEVPDWVNEGLAEYFAESIWVQQELRVGCVPPDRLARVREMVRKGSHVPFRQMTKLSVCESQAHYDQAWAMVHCLIEGDPRYHEAFISFLKRIARGQPADAAFAHAFQGDYDAFEKVWKRYVTRQLEPDPFMLAAERLEFLGHGMQVLWEKGYARDLTSIARLQSILRRMSFRLTVIRHGHKRVKSASDPAYFQAPMARNGGKAMMKLIPRRDRSELPPEILVRGLEMPVRLTWGQSDEGKPVSRVVFGK